VGPEAVGRIASRLIAERGVIASLIEYPAVPLGMARFRMQLMPTHTPEQVCEAARIIAGAIFDARELIGKPPWV
jgi:7-keto-8-aminopelargonate synthetase-like enzyme